jgi:hypothetical protein
MYTNIFGVEVVSSRTCRLAAALVIGALMATDTMLAQVTTSAAVNQRSAVIDGQITDMKGAPLT